MPEGRFISFLLGLLVIFIALVSPLNSFSHMLFTGHMAQHLLLALVAAPLLVLGLPAWLIEAALEVRSIRVVMKGLTNIFVTTFLFNGNLWLWHAQPILNAMMQNTYLHLLAQFLFLITGALFWWPLLTPATKALPSLNIAAKLLYIFSNDMPMVLLSAGLTLMPPLYSVYINNPTKLLDPAVDQHLGGALMWIPGSILFIVIASIIFLRWILDLEKKERAEAARMAELYRATELS
jgi:putative membrane protein